MGSSERRLADGIGNILIANSLLFVLNLITSMALPRFMPVDDYAIIKTYQLIISYVGIMHLGYSDGVFLRYSGCMDKKSASAAVSTMRLFQLIIMIIAIVISVFIGNKILFFCALNIFPLNMYSCIKMYCQTTGNYKEYKRQSVVSAVLTFFAHACVLFAFFTGGDIYNLFVYTIFNYFFYIYLEIRFGCFEHFLKPEKLELVNNIRTGFPLMMGNLVSFIFSGLDRWFVKFTMGSRDFAEYSFAVSVENILNLIFTAISLPLYNYLLEKNDGASAKRISGFLIAISSLILWLSFFIKYGVEVFVPNYRTSINIIMLLFIARILQFITQSIYVNLYKVKKQQKKYAIKLVVVMLSGCIFNIVLFALFKSKEAYAIGTILSSFLWLLLSALDFRNFDIGLKEVLMLIFSIGIYVFSIFVVAYGTGCLVYSLLTIFIVYLYRENILELLESFLKRKK